MKRHQLLIEHWQKECALNNAIFAQWEKDQREWLNKVDERTRDRHKELLKWQIGV